MSVGFGVSVGDLIAVGTLAWKVYQSAKESPTLFHNLSTEALSLQIVVQRVEETLIQFPLTNSQQYGLRHLIIGCTDVLEDAQKFIDRYGNRKTTKWSLNTPERISNLQSRIQTNVGLLTAFLSASQVSVLHKLDYFTEKIQHGSRDSAVLSVRDVESLGDIQSEGWRAIQMELRKAGLTEPMLNENRDFIVDWFSHLIQSGALAAKNERSVIEKAVAGTQSFFMAQDNDSIPSLPTGRGEVQEGYSPGMLLAKINDEALRKLDAGAKRISELTDNPRQPARNVHMDALVVEDSSMRKMWMETTSRYTRENIFIDTKQALLMSAIEQRQKRAVRLLVRGGADVNLNYRRLNSTTASGKRIAKLNGLLKPDFRFATYREQITGILLAEELVTNSKTVLIKTWARNITVLHEAAARGQEWKTRFLIRNGARIDAWSSPYGTALMIALCRGHESVARLLLELGAAPNYDSENFSNQSVKCPIFAAIIGGKASQLELLFKYGAATNWSRALLYAKGLSENLDTVPDLFRDDSIMVKYQTNDFDQIKSLLASRESGLTDMATVVPETNKQDKLKRMGIGTIEQESDKLTGLSRTNTKPSATVIDRYDLLARGHEKSRR